jgi:hypothetical protein
MAYQSNKNHSCAYGYTSSQWQTALNVSNAGLSAPQDPQTATLTSYCLELFETRADTGSEGSSMDGFVFDCRRRSWYYETKRESNKHWSST